MSNQLVTTQELSIAERNALRDTNISKVMTTVFNLTQSQSKEAKDISRLVTLKHGLTASIPIVCRGPKCAYIEVCNINPQFRCVGMKCLHEIGVMVARFESLCMELNVQDGDSVDIGLVKDVIDLEMMMLRIDKKFAISGDLLVDTWVAVDHYGNDHMAKDIDPLISLKLSMYDKKMKILEKLNSTRKDKIEENKKSKDMSIRTSSLMAKAKMISAQLKNQVHTSNDSIDTIEVEVQESNTYIQTNDLPVIEEEIIEDEVEEIAI